jgi:carboxypeptidase Q
VPEDLRQAAVVMATFLYNTAMRDQLLPRTARPQ